MTFDTFFFGIGALLLAPGPTNALMGLAGAQKGFGGPPRLLPAELAGYLAVILPLAWAGQQAFARWPEAAVALKLAAAVWVMVLAVRLWVMRGDGGAESAVTWRRVLMTTMLNPKAPIFALVFLPGLGHPAFLPRLAAFCGMVAAVAMLWGAGGALLRGGAGANRLCLVQRVAAIWLAVVSVSLIAGLVVA